MSIMAEHKTRLGERAFADFVHDGWARHLWLARLLARDWQDAEDLLQEALYRVYRSWTRAGIAEYPDAYLRATLVRLASRRARRQWNSETPTPFQQDTPLEVPDRDPHAARDLHHELITAISHLPGRQRAAIALRYLEDLSVADTATAMGCAEPTVKALTHQGLAALRRQLGRDEPQRGNPDD
jgi:RNA polymerase sigma-70 factor (sigma-E family)